jgi:acyl-CoA reductase-like NAD-dependent aldehyde dehydrogenase
MSASREAAIGSPDWLSRAEQLSPCVRNFIGGRWAPESSSEPLKKFSPRDGRLLYEFGRGSAHDADTAVAEARRAVKDGRWSKLSAQHRKEVLQKFALLIEQHSEELALLECVDVGKPISAALSFDIPVSAALIKFNAEAADKTYGHVYAADGSGLSYQLRRPLGVTAAIVGWNFPLVLAASKIGPALAAGNSLVLKPSELTSLSAARVAELALQAGVPEGVFNVVHGGPELGEALARHRDVDLLTFTGSTRTGKRLLVAAGESNMKRLILECGGKAPNIVFDDAPRLEAVAEAVVARAFYNQGEVCSASSRLLIQESIKDQFLPLLIEKASALRPGDPLIAQTTFGAAVSEGHKAKILGYIDDGKRQGARIAYQSDAAVPHERGFYVPPVIFDRVAPDQKIAQQEIFGPVLSVMSFKDEQDAIQIANDTIYGLSAILWTQDIARAHRLTQAVKAGWMVVNATETPMGGPGIGVIGIGGHKESGIGVEGSIEGLGEYMSKTSVQYFV